MFPLGTVLFPHALLPLHVFEPRYRALTRYCIEADGEMGIVLIERGSEVGGGDVRFSVGTRGRIVEAQEQEDGRWVLLLVGLDRLRVDEWLPESPYPRALVELIADDAAGPDAHQLRSSVERRLRRALALLAELGERAPPATVELAPDPAVAAYQAAALSPVGPADAQRLLEAPTTDDRLRLLDGMLADHLDVLAHRVAER